MIERHRKERDISSSNFDPYREMWRALTPAQRFRRSWRLRRRLKNLQAIHDAKSLPKL